MAMHRTRVGLHARNEARFPEEDYKLVQLARIETLKTMSFTDVSVYERLRRENPGIEFVVRLYDERINHDSRPSPGDFVAKMAPVIKRSKPYATKFEIHNEPNHANGIEGWGASDESARAFRSWYLQVLQGLKKACPWAHYGFPGLALNHPHRDLEWLDICREAIIASDWLGCHCYWQHDNMLKEAWGLRFQLYHRRFPSTQIEITEFGNSTPNLSHATVAKEYERYYQELNQYPYLGSASSFIASSPDPAWARFAWLREGGEMLPVVYAVRDMPREAVEVKVAWPPQPSEPEAPIEPIPHPERKFTQTGKTVRGSFLRFLDQYGLDICGYPITEQIEEDGVPSQYFQRVGLEEFQPDNVRLKMVGAEAWSSRKVIDQLQAQIKELRDRLGLEASPSKPAIEDIVEKLPTHASKQHTTRNLADIKQIVVHHSAAPPTVGIETIAHYHVTRMDWPGIGYHFVVTADGSLYQVNRMETVSHHAANVNPRSVGVCFLGNFNVEVPPADQLRAGAHLIAWLMDELHIAQDDVKGHREFMSTACPGNQWLQGQNWKQMLHQGIAKVQEMSPQSDPAADPGTKPIYHYLLFLAQDDRQVMGDWVSAQSYIKAFRPTIGFSAEDAVCAEYVTIVGGREDASRKLREWLETQGCKVDRIVGNPQASTAQILNLLVRDGRRFWTLART